MPLQMAELHYLSLPSYDAGAIAERVESLIHSGIECREGNDPSGTRLFFHTRHQVEYNEGSVPAQTAIFVTEKRRDLEHYAKALQQSWTCNDAAERLKASTASILVTEMMAMKLEPADRLALFHGVLQAVVELTSPHAIVFVHSQQVVAPEDYIAGCDEAPIQRTGSLNVRFFRISNSDTDDTLMDTRGLHEIGLPDLQCHFHDLDPEDVSRVLFNTAIYIAENGAVIESGNTIGGITPESKWVCQFENALVEPERELLDVNPGPEFAAGNR